MKVQFFLVVNQRGSTKTVKSKPALDWDEIAIAMSLDLPDALFRKPQLSAQIIIPAEAAAPTQINADVIENTKDAIQQATGMEVKICFVPQNNEEATND